MMIRCECAGEVDGALESNGVSWAISAAVTIRKALSVVSAWFVEVVGLHDACVVECTHMSIIREGD